MPMDGSGEEEACHGTNSHQQWSLMEWTPVSKRIIMARFYTRCRRMTVIQAYAKHNEKEEEKKEQFYQELQETLDGCNKNDIVIITGDLNAKVCNDNSGYERIGTRFAE